MKMPKSDFLLFYVLNKARRAGSDGSISASGSASPGFRSPAG